jgi:2-hydroxymuconate-semialdehyde hydrolase
MCTISAVATPVRWSHGSGLGVSAWANWRLVMPELAQQARAIGPDMEDVVFTNRPEGQQHRMDAWVEQAVGVLDALGIEKPVWWATPLAARWRWP